MNKFASALVGLVAFAQAQYQDLPVVNVSDFVEATF